MKPETYKIFNFAITQDNLELVQFILTQDQLSNEELIQSLNMAKAKPTILSVLSEMIPPPSVPEIKDEETTKEFDWKIDDYYLIDKKKMGKNSRLIKEIMSLPNIDPNDILEGLSKNKYSMEEINHQNDGGWTAMMILSLQGGDFSKQFIIAMMELGANINLKNNDGRNALLISLNSGKYGIAEIFLESDKLDVNEIYQTNEVLETHDGYRLMKNKYIAKYTILHYLFVEAWKTTYGKDMYKPLIKLIIENPKIDMSIENQDGYNIVDYWCRTLGTRKSPGYGEKDIFLEIFQQILKHNTVKEVKQSTLECVLLIKEDVVKIMESKKVRIKWKWSDILKDIKLGDNTKVKRNMLKRIFEYFIDYYPEGLTIEP